MNLNVKDIPELKPEEKRAIAEFTTFLRKKYGNLIKEIILFGSKIKGGSTDESDIDILIVLNNLTWDIKKSISELAAEINLKYNVLISTIRYDVNSWEDPVIKASPFVIAVKEEGIWL